MLIEREYILNKLETVIANRKKEREAKKIKLNMKCTGGEKHE